MNYQMEQEMERTIRLLHSSMPQTNRNVSLVTLLRIAASELQPFVLIILSCSAISFGLISAKFLAMPMLTVFCTAPMPMLLLFHRYVLSCNNGMRELEETFQYSYSEMLIGRTFIISVYMVVILMILSAILHYSVGESFLRLALCGAVPSIYLCTLLLFLSTRTHNQEWLSILAMVFWAALCFLAAILSFDQLLQICSTTFYSVLVIVGITLLSICSHTIRERRFLLCGQ